MSAAHENHTPVQLDDLHDRLMDVALAELVGGQTPPDMINRVLAAHNKGLSVTPEPTAARNYSRRFRWISVAVAASLLVGMATFLIATNRSATWKTAKLSAAADRLSQQTQIPLLVDEFNRLRDEQRYSEMENVARRLNELAPDDPAAKQVWQNSKFIRREQMNSQLTDNKESSVWEQLNAVEQSAVNPVTDGQEVAKDQKYWDQFVKERKQSTEHSAPQAPAQHGSRNLAIAPAPAATSEIAPPPVEGTLPSPYYLTDDVHSGVSNSTKAGPESGSSVFRGREFYDHKSLPQQTASRRPTTDTPGILLQEENQERFGLESSLEPAPAPASLAFNRRDDVLREINKPIVIQDEKELSDDVRAALRRSGGSGDQYTPIVENPFIKALGGDAVSTFGIDVDTASYSNVRQFLTEMHQLPPPNAVRIEELINYFNYDYNSPKVDDEVPFAAHVEVASCPWNAEHRLARIAIKGREMDRDKRPQSNLVFLVDVSGSMNEPAKLPLVIYGLKQLTKELGENDHIAIVVYAGTEGLALPSTSGSKQEVILAALDKLQAGGSTAGGAGIQLAYQIAEDNFIKGGTNRVILCTDGDFNVGVTSTDELQRLVEKKAKETGVFLSTLGFGRGNLNDAMMVAISDHGNGNYHYVDNRTEARRVLVEQMTGTLVTIAKDVKIQVEFNPAKVGAYRLIGYEKRMLKTEDFNNDKKDAGEIGAGHTVTALYEIVPAGKQTEPAPVDPLKYQQSAAEATGSADKQSNPATPSSELLTLKMRYKAPDGDTSKKLEWPITDAGKSFGEATDDFQFASAVAGFGLLLRDSQFKGDLTFANDLELAQSGIGRDEHGYRDEFLELVREAKKLKGE